MATARRPTVAVVEEDDRARCGGGESHPCPASCGRSFCSIWCMEQHRTERCSRRNYLCPTFAEFFLRPGSRLRRPWHSTGWRCCRPSGRTSTRGTTLLGRTKWRGWRRVHWLRSSSGPLRSAPSGGGEESRSASGKHLTGVPGLSKASAFEVRRANTLAQRAFKSLTKALQEHCLCFVCQPWDSYTPTSGTFLRRRSSGRGQVFSTSLPLCCFGGDQRWVEILHNSPAVHNSLHRAECLVHGESAKAWYEDSGRITFECCEELAFPPSLRDAPAQAIKRDLGEISPLIPGKLTDRSMEWQLMAQLRGAAAKLDHPPRRRQRQRSSRRWRRRSLRILKDTSERCSAGALQRHRGSAHGARRA